MKVRLEVNQLHVGHYVYLPLKWGQHPFLLNSFKIKNDEQLNIIKQLGIKTITINALKSDVHEQPDESLTHDSAPENETVSSSELIAQDSLQEMWLKKHDSCEQFTAIEDRIHRSKEAFANTLNDVQEIFDLDKLNENPSVSKSVAIVNFLYKNISSESGSAIHLMNDSVGYNRLHYHSLNVSLLAVLICQAKGFTPKQCQLVAFSALYHDIGKVQLPVSLLAKPAPLEEYDQKRLCSHVEKSLKMSAKIPKFPEAALKLIGQHHELNDGSGYPNRLNQDEIHQLSRVLILANAYDNLCNSVNSQLSPHSALTHLYNKCRGQHDVKDIMALISVVGVYPPGTIVELSDHQIGVVISTNKETRLSPYILIYDQNVPRAQAAIINIAEFGLSITNVLDSKELTLDQYHYLNPSAQSTYFIDVE
ncbi:HD-GYP domain-containing protein [Vibrio ichthyoenteri ATCC 700023]|uniref:HD-GYP domain-containing protein n=1 Tax=Vibrio ichthyoenteri ATCC 700023 TaxID=870968 RepID=F9S6R1_9VIBR|nr:HD domain-containing phosphohydrolase [Vibrio ichthyoenteri]EGU32611.1 HD-GYP domain-containing protein [Vibrio ichthyoenteri ATCC 700023]